MSALLHTAEEETMEERAEAQVESQEMFDYEYAIIRVVPRVHIGDFVNIGVLLHARTARYLDAVVGIDRAAVARLGPDLDFNLLERFVDAYLRVCRGGSDAGSVGVLPASGRFHWLTSPRSGVLQTSVVHPGRCRNPEEALARMYAMYCGGPPAI